MDASSTQNQFTHKFQSHGKQFAIKTYDNSDKSALEDYCQQCDREGVVNNSSIYNLKLGRMGEEQWWLVYDELESKIVSVSGCYHFKEYKEGAYRCMFRLATLKDYRGKAGPFSKDQKSCFGWGRLLPFQVAWAKSQGANKLIFTTNSGDEGDVNSLRQNRVCELVFEKLGMAKKIDEIELYYKKQNLWEVLIEDVYSKKRISL